MFRSPSVYSRLKSHRYYTYFCRDRNDGALPEALLSKRTDGLQQVNKEGHVDVESRASRFWRLRALSPRTGAAGAIRGAFDTRSQQPCSLRRIPKRMNAPAPFSSRGWCGCRRSAMDRSQVYFTVEVLSQREDDCAYGTRLRLHSNRDTTR
jgi:hypothetical protein